MSKKVINRRKWKETYDLPELVEIRNKIKNVYNDKLDFIEESHQYFLKGDREKELISVSELVKTWITTDGEELLETCATKALTEKDYKYYGKSKEEIKEVWDSISKTACDFGSATHAFGESCFYWFIGEDDKILPECRVKFSPTQPLPSNKHEAAVVKFWYDLPECFIPILAETKVFNTEIKPYAGTFDILFYYLDKQNPNNSGLMIFDYKTNKSLLNDYARENQTKMKKPFDDCFDEPLSHYILQLNLYGLCLENIGFNVICRVLIWLRQDGSYEKWRLPYANDRIKEALVTLP